MATDYWHYGVVFAHFSIIGCFVQLFPDDSLLRGKSNRLHRFLHFINENDA